MYKVNQIMKLMFFSDPTTVATFFFNTQRKQLSQQTLFCILNGRGGLKHDKKMFVALCFRYVRCIIDIIYVTNALTRLFVPQC